MKKLIVVTILVASLVSCQKEISWDGVSTTTGSGNGKKLVKLTQKTGSDSAIANYTYNSANSLVEYSAVQTASGVTADVDIAFTRNSSNIITRSVVTSTQLASIGTNGITTNYVYDATNSKYKYSITTITITGITYRDSIIYSYDASNRLINDLEYADTGNGSAYELTSKEEYVYTGNNATSAKVYSYNGTGGASLDETIDMEFDSKTNPLQFTADAVPLRVIDLYNIFYSVNNVTKQTRVTTSPSATNIGTYVYTYNSNNMPATAVISQDSGTTNLTFYYQ